MSRWIPILALVLCCFCTFDARALILVGGSEPFSSRALPAGTDRLANLPTRFGHWEGPPFGGGDYHFEYAGNTAQFQKALDTFALIEAPRLELLVYDGVTSSVITRRQVDWEFEIWNKESFYRLNHPPNNITLSTSPWFRQPLPPPRLSLYLGDGKHIDWSAIHLPHQVTLLDRRVATSPWSSSGFGVIHAVVYDMATSRTLPGAILEVGSYDKSRQFQALDWRTANKAGEVVLKDIPAGNFAVQVRCKGYATREVGYYDNHGRTLGVFDRVSLSPASALKGRVTDSSGQPVVDATVGVSDLVGLDGMGYIQNPFNERSNAQTDAAGRFTLDPLPRGRVSLSVRKPGYHYFSFETHAIPGDVNIVMTGAGEIHGRVIGSPSAFNGPGSKAAKRPLIVQIEPLGGNKIGSWGGSMQLKEDGRFEFKDVPAGKYIITAQPNPMHGNEVTPPKPVTVEAGKTVEVEIPFSQAK